MSDIRIGTLKKNASAIELDLIKLVNSSKATQESMESMANKAATEIEELLKPALKGLASSQEQIATASKQSTDSQINDINRLIERYNELNKVKLSGTGSFSTVKSIESLNRALEDEADK